MFFEATFSRTHVAFGILGEGEHGLQACLLHRYPLSEISNILRNIEYTFVHSILLVMKTRYGPMPHHSVYLISY